MKIGFDYGRMVTGEEQQIEPDLAEEAVQAAGNQEVPDPLEEKAMVVTSEEVMFVSDYFTTLLFTMFYSVLPQALAELSLDAVDLVGDAPTFFDSPPQDEHGELHVTLFCLNTLSNTSESCLDFHIMYMSTFNSLQSCQVPVLPLMCQKTQTCPPCKVISLVLDD